MNEYPLIKLKPVLHRKEERILLDFPYNKALQQIVKTIPKAFWSQSKKCWHIPLQQASYKLLQERIKGSANLDTSALKTFLQKKKFAPAESLPVKLPAAKTPAAISSKNATLLAKTVEQLQLKAYSPSTIRTYRNEISIFMQALKNTEAATLPPERLRKYFLHCINNLKLRENTIHSRLNALKFMYEQVLGREKFFVEIPRPKKPLILPKVLGEKELVRLFNAAPNLKHKAILFVAYSAGLRVSEVINLRWQDIDRERQQIFVHCSKGKKDRYVPLSILVVDILEQYYRLWKPKPKTYVFEGSEGACYTMRSAQQIFSDCKSKAGIAKTMSFHGLRHSYATHMLEKGIDSRIIKDLLGHFSIKTTERYLHVRKEFLVNIISPLDDLFKNEHAAIK